MQRREEVEFEERSRVIERCFGNGVVRATARVVDEAVNPPEALDSAFDERCPKIIDSEIARQNEIVGGSFHRGSCRE